MLYGALGTGTASGDGELRVSRLCLGTMNFGPQTNEQDSARIMDHAHERGITPKTAPIGVGLGLPRIGAPEPLPAVAGCESGCGV